MPSFSVLPFALLFSLLKFCAPESVEEEQGDPYYGVPLGALHYSAEGTSAEVYAADEFSIIFNHFYHNPREYGCTAMMIGPPRAEDREHAVPEHGILLPMAHPPASARHRKRAKRGARAGRTAAIGGQFRGYWPAEFDHLLMGPSSGEKDRERGAVTVNRVNLSNTSVTQQILQNNWAVEAPSLPRPSPSQVFSVEGASAQPSTPPFPPPTRSSTPRPTSTSVASSPAPRSSTSPPVPSTTNSASPPAPTQPLILLGNKRAREGAQQHSIAVANVVAKSPESKEAIEQLVRGDAELRRAPSRQGFDEHPRLNEWVKANELDEKGVPPTVRPPAFARPITTTPSTTPSTTPLFWVINDPREQRRQRLLELRRKLDPNPEPTTTTTTAKPLSPLDPQFVMSRVRDKLVTFSLQNGAKITQYKWIGLWNHCTKRHIPLVSLRDVDPPREEKIMPMSGWSHNVTSYRLHILNCNTILIPSFHYDARNTTANTFFFVGVGQFPEAVEHQVKATVVGTKPGQPLRSYSGEDVLLRLPRPYRTFDIDFISIFNTDEQKSFGHVIIPSLLVPPCPDDDN